MSLKELARSVLPAPIFAAARTARQRLRFGGLHHAAVFAKIHAENIWESAESISGHGSTLADTAVLRDELERWLAVHRPALFVDLPCGDFNWMQHVAFPEGSHYLGLDILPVLVDEARTRYASPVRRFEVADILTGDLPEADVYFCKDLFIHFPNAATAEARDRVLPRCRFLIATTWPELTVNEDIRFGGARRINLELIFGPPTELLKSFAPGEEGRYMGVWAGNALTPFHAPAL